MLFKRNTAPPDEPVAHFEYQLALIVQQATAAARKLPQPRQRAVITAIADTLDAALSRARNV